MIHAVAGALPMAIAIAVFPVPIIAVVLLLTTARARVLAPLFVTGWVVGLGLVGTVAVLLSDAAHAADTADAGSAATWVSVLKIVIAAALLVLAGVELRSRSGPDRDKTPAFMGRLDSAGPALALGTGLALAGANPKNLLLMVAGGTTIAQTGAPGPQQALALALFVVVASVGVGLPTLVFFVLGERALPTLARLKDWMGRHMATLMAGLCVLIALVLLIEAVNSLRA